MKKYKFTFNQQEKVIDAKCIITAIKKFKKNNPEVKSYTVTTWNQEK